MGGGGGPSSTKTSTMTDIAPWAQPYAKAGLQSIAGLTMPGSTWVPTASGGWTLEAGPLAQMPPELAQQYYGLTPEQQQAITGLGASALGSESQIGQNIGQLANQTVGGQFLGPEQNPYLRQTYEQAAQAMTDKYRTATAPSLQGQAAQAGALGGSAYNQAAMQQQYGLGQNLANLATDIYGGAYETERGRQQQAMLAGPQIAQGIAMPYEQLYQAGALTQADQQAQEQMRLQNAMRGQQYPFQMVEQLGNALAALTGRQSIGISPNLAQGIK